MRTETYIYGVEPLSGNDAWQMFEACTMGNLARVRELLRRDQRLVNAQYWYQLPLHGAVRGGHTKIVELLLRKGADPGQSRHTYNSWNRLLEISIARGYADIERMLESELTNRFGFSRDFERLKQAIIARDNRRVQQVLKKYPELIHSSDAFGNNVLHWSVLTRQPKMMSLFVDAGVAIDKLRCDGQTPILLAVNHALDYWYRVGRARSDPSLRNTWVMVGGLLALGAEYNLSVAAAVGDELRATELLGAKPSLANQLDSARVSPLTYAAREGYVHIVKLLLDRGADPNRPEELAPRGRALFEACETGHMAVARLLLERGADANAGVDSCGCCWTIAEVGLGPAAKPIQRLLERFGATKPPYAMNANELRQAIRNQSPVLHHEEFVTCAIGQLGANAISGIMNSDAKLLESLDLHQIASHPQSERIVRSLISRGWNPDSTDWVGRTMLHASAETGNEAVVRQLVKAGADVDTREAEFWATPLATAVRAGATSDDALRKKFLAVIKSLLDSGAHRELANDKPWSTPAAWAKQSHWQDALSLLA